MTVTGGMRKNWFLSGVFLITFSSLIFQILQTRIMSVVQWYSMAFLAISVAMLGMTVGAVWVYLRRERFESAQLPVTLSNYALLAALAMPASMILQFCLITAPAISLTTVVSWSLLLALMAVPYFFVGVVVSLALTRSPFPTGQVYGVDLIGAALGCIAVLVLLNLLDGPSAVFVAGAIRADDAGNAAVGSWGDAILRQVSHGRAGLTILPDRRGRLGLCRVADVSSPAAVKLARNYVIEFVVNGFLRTSAEAKI